MLSPDLHPRADQLEAAALAMVGTAFRPQGRGRTGCDCLGLVLVAAAAAGVRIQLPLQPMRGVGLEDARRRLRDLGCRAMPAAAAQVGDVLLQAPATLQVHLAVRVRGGLVEAHAGLRRVVVRPFGPDEQWDSAWRLPVGE
jgi:cell wall-associated NlpC family hydrolase